MVSMYHLSLKIGSHGLCGAERKKKSMIKGVMSEYPFSLFLDIDHIFGVKKIEN
jgi:hypothetical protein